MADEVTNETTETEVVTEETAEAVTPEEQSPENSTEEAQPEKDANYWKEQARKNEKQAKANLKEIERQGELLKKLAEKAGLSDEEEAPTADALAERLTTAQQIAREKSVQLAVYKTASKLDADVDALLDSNTFLNKVATLDPSSEDFDEEVSTAIAETLTANPRLKVTRPLPKKAGVEMTGGHSEKTWTKDELARMTPAEFEANHESIMRQLAKGK
ncbi:hypothetical protein OHA74_20765 [Streptomyces phaeochromogenes]|uniref:hypothetical protein n=1 Tax=Streptomyces phaeochromogenes TaxID=1923 RepID=UPI002E2D836F|nr:hypothetical protein [Streptomyces phaeochromogenes]